MLTKEVNTASINFEDKLKMDSVQQQHRFDDNLIKLRKNTYAAMDDSLESQVSDEDMKLFKEEDQSMKREDEEIYGGLGLWLRGEIAQAKEQ